MTFAEYQKASEKTAIYPNSINHVAHWTLGVTGEAGEIANKVFKVFREKNGQIDEATKKELGKEIGDTLWYLTQLTTALNLSLETIAEDNIAKLQSRQQRGTLTGDGDNR